MSLKRMPGLGKSGIWISARSVSTDTKGPHRWNGQWGGPSLPQAPRPGPAGFGPARSTDPPVVVPHSVHSSREQMASMEFQNSVVIPLYDGFFSMRVRLPFLISHPASQPNWKL